MLDTGMALLHHSRKEQAVTDGICYKIDKDRHCEYYIEKLKNFLQSNKNNQDLKAVLNLKRGESGWLCCIALIGM
ncbi:MAG: hypothetical protein ABS251_04435 [Wolbachia endosymbiont of Ephestia elutella]|uniref:Uncharacterized protein n=1 Tax=Wolbachia endosymbiont of Ephestia elutella TaxID=3231696 RepID=A0AAU8MIU6_9RICK